MAKNVLGGELITCSDDPLTGYFRNGKCDTCGNDTGMHMVCAQMTDKFLEFSRERENDLITPVPAYNFPGLRHGDFWCLCLQSWIEAHKAGVAPRIRLSATHTSVLEFVDLDILKSYAVG
ncbi:MAG: DUF2237 family protein [Opitutaceae bacterium]